MTLSAARLRVAPATLLLSLVASLPGCEQEPGRESDAAARRADESDLASSQSSDPPSEELSDGDRAEQALAERDYGPKRDDLSRFKGRYGDPNRANEHHVWSVGETCAGSGHLALAAMWGDVAPWRLASESDLVFTEPYPQPNYEPFRLAFQASPDGSIMGVILSGPFEGTLERLGDLREGWETEGEDCLYR